ncbi:MAG: CapA family protein [Ruminococcus sp.]|nr:CapA family protein [Ruminococcus sp.]
MSKRCAAMLLAMLLTVSASGCGTARIEHTLPGETEPAATLATGTPAAPLPEETTQPPTETLPLIQDATVSFLAVGDNLVQTSVYKTAASHAEEGEDYDFSYCYQHVADRIAAADVAFINQETVIAEGYEVSGSNFNFNSPPELGYEVLELGFDVICHANNHALDKGTGGLSATLDFWDARMAESETPIQVIGAYRDAEDMSNYRIAEVNGMTIGYLAYTEHINGYRVPEDSPIKIPLTSDTALIESQIKELSGMVDAVVVSAHWGNEDTHTVRDDVKTLAADMIEWGADVILGTHSHTLETMEYITRSDGTKGFVFYSLGNFISAQTDNFNMVGGMAEFNLHFDADTMDVTVEDVRLTPVITHYDNGSLRNIRVYPYDKYTDELVAGHGVPYSPAGTAKSWNRDVIEKIIYNNVPEEFRNF